MPKEIPPSHFETFIQQIQPTIKAMDVSFDAGCWVPYAALFGVSEDCAIRWKREDMSTTARENALNLLALQEIALMAETVEQAAQIARDRLSKALSNPVTVRNQKRGRAPLPHKPTRVADWDTARAIELRQQGWTLPDISRDVGVSEGAVRAYLYKRKIYSPNLQTPQNAHQDCVQ